MLGFCCCALAVDTVSENANLTIAAKIAQRQEPILPSGYSHSTQSVDWQFLQRRADEITNGPWLASMRCAGRTLTGTSPVRFGTNSHFCAAPPPFVLVVVDACSKRCV